KGDDVEGQQNGRDGKVHDRRPNDGQLALVREHQPRIELVTGAVREVLLPTAQPTHGGEHDVGLGNARRDGHLIVAVVGVGHGDPGYGGAGVKRRTQIHGKIGAGVHFRVVRIPLRVHLDAIGVVVLGVDVVRLLVVVEHANGDHGYPALRTDALE